MRNKVALLVVGLLVVVGVVARPQLAEAKGTDPIGRIESIEVVPSDDPTEITLHVTGWAIDPTNTGQVLFAGRTVNVAALYGSLESSQPEVWRLIGRGGPVSAGSYREDIPKKYEEWGPYHGFDFVMVRQGAGLQLSGPFATGNPTQVCLDLYSVPVDGTSTGRSTICKNFKVPA
jgi:hypothetical protein